MINGSFALFKENMAPPQSFILVFNFFLLQAKIYIVSNFYIVLVRNFVLLLTHLL